MQKKNHILKKICGIVRVTYGKANLRGLNYFLLCWLGIIAENMDNNLSKFLYKGRADASDSFIIVG